MLRVLLLRELILCERLLRLAEKTEAIAEIGPNVGDVGIARDRRLIVLDRVRPVLAVIVPVRQRPRGVSGSEL